MMEKPNREFEGREYLVVALLPVIGFVVSLIALTRGEHVLYAMAAPAALLFLALCFLFPYLAILLLFFYSTIQYFFTITYEILPPVFAQLDDGILLALLARAFVEFLSHPSNLLRVRPFLIAFVLFFLLSFVSLKWNGVDPQGGLLSIRHHNQYPLLYLILVTLNPPARVRKILFRLFFAIVIFQLPVMLFQFLTAGAELDFRSQNAPDLITGTMGTGAGNTIGYVLLFALAILIGRYAVKGQGNLIPLVILSPFLLIGMVLCGARMSYIILFMFLSLVALRYTFKRPAVLLFSGLVISLLAGLAYYYTNFVLTDSDTIFSLETNLHSESDPTNVGRLAYYPIAYEVLTTRAAHPFVGTGPGTFFSLSARRFMPEIQESYNYLAGVDRVVDSSIIATGTEYGFGGLALYYLMILLVFVHIRRVRLHHPDPYWAGTANGFYAAILVYLITPLIMNVWEFQTINTVFWSLAAMLTIERFATEKAVEQEAAP